MTLHGMELLIDFEGTTYKTTLRAPNPSQSKSYFFNMTAMNGKLPNTVSVAPVFILDARQVLGDITSKVNFPILNIVKEYNDIILELEEENAPEIVLNESVLEQSNVCDTPVGEDPWGGCPIAAGDMENVSWTGYSNFYIYYSGSQPPLINTAQAYLKLGGDGNCVPSNYADECISLNSGWWGPSGNQYRIVVPKNSLAVSSGTTNCGVRNWFYIYKNSNCE